MTVRYFIKIITLYFILETTTLYINNLLGIKIIVVSYIKFMGLHN